MEHSRTEGIGTEDYRGHCDHGRIAAIGAAPQCQVIHPAKDKPQNNQIYRQQASKTIGLEGQVVRQFGEPFEVQQRSARRGECVRVSMQERVACQELLRITQVKPYIGLCNAQDGNQGDFQCNDGKPQYRKREEVATVDVPLTLTRT